MPSEDIKVLFDKAYSYLHAGDPASAAMVFQQVIDQFETTNASYANLARQRIRWYCIPLETILDEWGRPDHP